ncbi:MAG: DUF4416 family protein [Elusimicrobiota bacterium]
MGMLKDPGPVKLFTGMLTGEVELFDKAEPLLVKLYGNVDYRSGIMDFKHTNYYEDELGKVVYRRFVSFNNLMSPGQLARIKVDTNKVESLFLSESTKKRRINIDPGYIDYAKLVLASTKDFAHRLYIGEQVFAEVTLQYHKGMFVPFGWTYPDYKTEEYNTIFLKIRELYSEQVSRNKVV